MRRLRIAGGLFAIFVSLAAAVLLALSSGPVARSSAPPGTAAGKGAARAEVLPGRVVHVGKPSVEAAAPGVARVGVPVSLDNTGTTPLTVEPADFLLMARGDAFGQVTAPAPSGTLSGSVAPGQTSSGTLTFLVPDGAVSEANVFYHSSGDAVTGSIAFDSSTGGPEAVGGADIGLDVPNAGEDDVTLP